MCVISNTFAQSRKITGKVTGADDGQPLPGVSVVVKGSTSGTQTDQNGNFTLDVPANATALLINYVGFANQEVEITGRDNVTISLKADLQSLNEVVVVGYGTTTKAAFTGTAKTVSSEQIDKKRVSNVTQALAGEVSGVRVVNTSGQPGTVATVRVRGFGSINGNRDPLYVIDGVPLNGGSQATNSEGILSSINPADVESMTVLKDASATSIYGSRGSAGVVLITTKSGKNKKSYIEANFNFGTNAQLLPRYDVIKSPEQYAGLSWEGLYNQYLDQAPAITGGNPSTPADRNTYATNLANTRLFSSRGLPTAFNIWNSTGPNLIDPVTRTVKAGISRKYDPEDWSDYAFQQAARTEANVSLGGGTDKAGYYMSLGYLNDKGYSIASDYKRLTGRLNLNTEIKPWLNAAMNLNYATSKQNAGGQTGDSGSIFWFVDNIPPIYGLFLRDANGNIVPDPIFGGNQYDYGDNGRKFGSLTNSIADTRYNTNRNDRDDVNGNVSLNAKITKGLTFENTFGLQHWNRSHIERNNKFYGSAASQSGSIYLDRQDVTSYNLLNLLRYKKDFGNNNLEVFAAHEITSYKFGDLAAFKTGLVLNESETLNNAAVSTPSSSYTEGYKLDSYFAQASYNYKQKYFLQGTIRRDGSSRFVNKKWGTFGSVGAAWLVSSESFMESQNIFSSLKIKASYGTNGDQSAVGYYAGRTLSDVTNVNDLPGLGIPLRPGNPDLTWEATGIFNTGVEFNIGKFLTADIEYYLKNAKNQLFNRFVAPSAGYQSFQVNDGGLRNSGLEFDLTAHILKAKDYRFDFGVNGEILSNKITKMPIDPSTGLQQIISPQGVYAYSKGHSLYDFYTRSYNGVNSANGHSVWNTYYVDLNGDGKAQTGTIEAGTGEYIASVGAFDSYVASHQNVPGINNARVATTTETYTDASLQYTGQSSVPAVRGAFNLTGGYKGFDLSVQVLYSLGGYAYDGAYAGLMDNDLVGSNNYSTDILRRWQKPGDVTDVPRLSNSADPNVASSSTRFITKADYLSINNVRLSYTFGQEIYSKLGMSALNIFVSGDNLYFLSKRKGFNPSTAENGASDIYRYSPLSTISAGLRARF